MKPHMKGKNTKYGGVQDQLGSRISSAQALRLKQLSEEAYQPGCYTRHLTGEEAERRIAALEAEIALANSF